MQHQSALNKHLDDAVVRNSGHREEIKTTHTKYWLCVLIVAPTLNNQINQIKIQSYTPSGCQLVVSISSTDIS